MTQTETGLFEGKIAVFGAFDVTVLTAKYLMQLVEMADTFPNTTSVNTPTLRSEEIVDILSL
jgi:hypothetical protein